MGIGVVNTTTLTATTAGLINGAPVPSVVFATDATTVIAGNLVLIKAQALDAACDGTADTAYSTHGGYEQRVISQWAEKLSRHDGVKTALH